MDILECYSQFNTSPNMLILEKKIEKGSLRWIGQMYDRISPQNLVIAGNGLEAICDELKLNGYRIGRVLKFL